MLILFAQLWLLSAAGDATDETYHAGRESFVRIGVHYLTNGKICRKIDSVESPGSVVWRLDGATNTIHIERREPASEGHFCQASVRESLWVGPLTVGEWHIRFPGGAAVNSEVAYVQRRKLEIRKSMADFSLERRAMLVLRMNAHGNSTGACREWVPVALTRPAENGEERTTLRAFMRPGQGKRAEGICRAMPQMLGNGVFELSAGKYRLTGEGLSAAELFEIQ